ncbi:hypothetical protein HY636_00005 [Candidatus Woesearchaeota archaeon]|nr:hypothetical protein [Candidatus Woesearchaeota archaeon]
MGASIISNLNLKDYVLVYKKQICPFPVLLVVPGYNKFMKKYLGFPLAELVVLIDDGMWAGHIEMKNWNDAKEKIFALYQKNPKIIDEFIAKLKPRAKMFLNFTSSIKKDGLKLFKLSDKELAGLYKKYCDEYISSYMYSEPAPNLLKDIIEKKLKERLINLLKDEDKLNKVFSLLTIPSVLEQPFPIDSFVVREEKELLKIAILVKKNYMLEKRRSINTTEDIAILLKKKGVADCIVNDDIVIGNIVKKKLEKHAEEYAWLPVDYNGEPWTLDNFKERLNEILNDKISPEEKLKILIEAPKKLKKEQLAIKKEYDIDDKIFYDCITAQKCMAAMDIKKEVCSTSHYHLQFLMKEIGRRLGLTLTQANYLTPNEAELALTNNQTENKRKINDIKVKNIKSTRKKFTKKFLNARYHQSCYIEGETEVNFLDKDDENAVRKIIEKAPESKDKLIGICGNPGYIKGKARVILETKDFHKMQKGEILVTSFTTPEFVIVMKKSAGIVTDMGGVTSHSSIVARELNIPCVVGTKFSTKLIKDGDVLEIDAGNGVVRIVK